MLTPDSDKQDAIARLSRLAEHGLDKMKSLSFCTFPMKGTKGLFEVRKNGSASTAAGFGEDKGARSWSCSGPSRRRGRRRQARPS